jgi:hypothetical protein
MKPRDVDNILPRLQVLARSSPEDKFLLVTRLNGYCIPANREEWEKKFQDTGLTWETHRDLLLPGYRDEWEETRPEGGQVVGVTGMKYMYTTIYTGVINAFYCMMYNVYCCILSNETRL